MNACVGEAVFAELGSERWFFLVTMLPREPKTANSTLIRSWSSWSWLWKTSLHRDSEVLEDSDHLPKLDFDAPSAK